MFGEPHLLSSQRNDETEQDDEEVQSELDEEVMSVTTCTSAMVWSPGANTGTVPGTFTIFSFKKKLRSFLKTMMMSFLKTMMTKTFGVF